MRKVQNRPGQVLLIAVMMLTTIITVVMTIAFNSTTETQVARLEADSQKALAAAEAGIDAVIKQSISQGTSFDVGTLDQFKNQKITGNAQVMGTINPYFISPLLQSDEQYTFYLSDYSHIPPAAPIFSDPWTGNLDLYLVSEGGCPSIEVTIIKSDYAIDRYAYNTCSNPVIITGASPATVLANPTVIDGVSFSYKIGTQIQIPVAPSVTGGLVAFVKVLNGRTKLGFKGYNADGIVAKTLPIQGKTVESEARTSTGVVKKVQLFQSYPQIPSNFFMTSF